MILSLRLCYEQVTKMPFPVVYIFVTYYLSFRHHGRGLFRYHVAMVIWAKTSVAVIQE